MTRANSAQRVSFRPVGPSDAPDLIAINRACPIESDFTLRFDREPDFFAWPRAVFDSYDYLGFYDGDRLVGYGLVGYRDGWTGCAWTRWAYVGDLRVVPEYRGEGIARRGVVALLERVPLDVSLGFVIVKRGNAVAERLTRSFRLESVQYDRAGVLEVVNFPIRPRAADVATVSSRPAVAADLPPSAALLRRAWESRLFAPRVEDDGGRRLGREVDAGHVVVATRGDRLVGLMGWHDFGDARRATILRYSARSWPLRAAWRVARGAGARIAAMPRPGDSLRTATVTHLGVEDADPAVLGALVDAAMLALAGGGVHLLQVAEMRGHPLLESLRGRCQWRFRSDVWIGWRTGARSPVADARRRPPFIDLAII
jgi:GNAT superfamily N-acetyltransferase